MASQESSLESGPAAKKVLIFGHSYARDLEALGDWDTVVTGGAGKEYRLTFDFRSFPGKDYGWLLEHPEKIEEVKDLDPDIVVVILGGNSITAALTNKQICGQAAEFYELLKAAAKPSCLKLAVQVESRFVPQGNYHQAPPAVEFNQRRTIINNFVNRKLRAKGLVDNMILLGGRGHIIHPSNFSPRDGVHLVRVVLRRYKQTLMNGIRYALGHRL